MFRLHCALFIFALVAFQTCSQNSNELTVLSWNVQNLFDGHYEGHEYPEFNPKLGKWNDRAYQARLKTISNTILAASPSGPDLVVLLEIEHGGVISDLATSWLSNRGYSDWLFVGPKSGGIGIGIISKAKIQKSQALGLFYKDQELRPIVKIGLLVGQKPLQLYALHFKSMRDGESKTKNQRILGNEVLVNDINRTNLPSIALGDFNSPHLDALPRQCSEIIPSNLGQVGGTYLINKKWESLDHVIASDKITCEVRIITEPNLVNEQGQPRRYMPSLLTGVSDHLPLLASLRLE